MISEFEQKEIDRIINQKVGSLYVISEQEMQYVISKYIKIRKGISISIDFKKGLDVDLIQLFPEKYQDALVRLNEIYSFVVNWLIENREEWTKINTNGSSSYTQK